VRLIRSDDVLRIGEIHSYYGPSHVLQGVTLNVPARGIVALIGRNGAGKTTTMKTVMGLVECRAGSVQFKDTELRGMPTHRIALQGISYIPESRGIIPGLTVTENLQLAVLAARTAGRDGGKERWDKVMEFFPVLQERHRHLGTNLSGGEQQMLALARAFLAKPDLILVDEPTQGLAPKIVTAIIKILARMNSEEGTAILVVEQNASLALEFAHHAYIMDQGVIVRSGPAAEIRADTEVQRKYLGA
jgi:branched-chain amino acid transport system ATP-binding protein